MFERSGRRAVGDPMSGTRSGARVLRIAALLAVGVLTATGLSAGTAGAAGAAGSDDPSISGTLLDSDGAPAVDALVRILDLEQNYVTAAFTGPEGQWEKYSLHPGQYKVEFTFEGTTSYAFSQPDFDRADLITIGDTTTVVNDRMLPAPVPTLVTGVVRDAVTHRPLAGICTSWAPEADPSDRRVSSPCTAADGKYTLHVEPGHWVLGAADEQGRYAAAELQPFDIADGQTLTRSIELRLGGGVRGTVVDRVTGTPLAGVCPFAYLGRQGAYVIGQFQTCSDQAGRWSVRSLPTGEAVTVQLGGDATHVDLWATDSTSQRTARLFTPRVGPLVAAGTTRLYHGAELTGRITTSSGEPVVGALVDLGIPSYQWCREGCSGRETHTDWNGRYTMSNLPPQQSVVGVSAFEQPLAAVMSGGVTDPDQARELTFAFDGHVTFDAVMPPQAQLTVAVTGASDSPRLSLDAYSPSGRHIVGVNTGERATDGTFTLTGLPGSDIKLKVSNLSGGRSFWYGGATTPESAEAITLTAGETKQITFAVP
jgi:Carboxypeptidase regulatory-like domain